MIERVATCQCGQFRASCTREPVRVSVCHCLACQKRSGGAFAAQARWPNAQVDVVGEAKSWVRVAGSGNRVTHRLCPDCGSTIAYAIDDRPGVTAIPVGAFADLDFPAPKFLVYENA